MASLEKIGLYYILKTMILRELNLSAKADSYKIYLLIETLNDSLVNEVQHGRYDNLHKEELAAEATFLHQLSDLSTRLGFSDPLTKVYFKPKAIEHIPIIMSYVLYNLVSTLFAIF
jgi:Hereditary spastic paraplegia protein strumpellin